MKYPCIETTIDCVASGFDVRLWINHKEIPKDHEMEEKLAARIENLSKSSINVLLQKIIKMVPNLNAVQIRDGLVGTVVYTVDFGDKDPHG